MRLIADRPRAATGGLFRIACLVAATAVASLASSPAQAYWRGGIWFGVPVAPYRPPPVYVAPPYPPPPGYYVPYAPPPRVWVYGHWGPWGWVPGHWEYR
jgi:hypothetical protein